MRPGEVAIERAGQQRVDMAEDTTRVALARHGSWGDPPSAEPALPAL
jgi:hypothetical protein